MYYRASRRPLALGAEIGAGGEARIFNLVDEPRLVAKVFHQPTALRAAKLRAMLASPPHDPSGERGQVSIAWPSELIFDGGGSPGGFLMPRIDFSRAIPLLHLYNPGDRLQRAPGFTWRYLLRVLRNLSSVVETLHARGYVVGDLNESNVLVSDSALVTLVDCDSIQVPMPGGGFFRCTVGKPEYTPPELQGCQFGGVDRDVSHDAFGLAVLAFMLLMEGFHPFAGVWNAPGDPPTVEERIKLGVWPYQSNPLATPPPYAPAFDLLPDEIRRLFTRAFRDGCRNPAARPGPADWKRACEATELRLRECKVNRQHAFSQHVRQCPWCERVRQGFPDPYPPIANRPALSPVKIPSGVRRVERTPPVQPHPASPVRYPSPRPTSAAVDSATGWYLRSSSWIAYAVAALLGAQLPSGVGVTPSIVGRAAANADLLLGVGPIVIAALALLDGALRGSPRRLSGALTAYLAACVVLFVAVTFCQQFVGEPSPANFAVASGTLSGAVAALLALLGGRFLHRRVAAHLARNGIGLLPATRVIGSLGASTAALAIAGFWALGPGLAIPTIVAGASAQRPVPTVAAPVAPTVSSGLISTTAPRRSTPTPVEAVARHLVVANTGGEGVYLRHTPRMADKWIAWPDRTRLDVVGPDADGDGHHWKRVRDPDGHVGWVPAEYVVAVP